MAKDIIDEFVARAIRVNRAFESEALANGEKLRKIHDKIIKLIESRFEGASRQDIQKIERLISQELVMNYQLNNVYGLSSKFQEVIAKELAWNAALLSKYALSDSVQIPEAKRLAKNAINKTYKGHTFNFWFKQQGAKSAKQIQKLLVSGFSQGQTTAEVTRSISAVMNKSNRDIKTLTRSYLQHASQEARLNLYSNNKDIIDGYFWMSVLDFRTTPNICGVRDSLEYDVDFNPVGHDYPWEDGPGRIHFNCRSTFVPKIIGVPINFERPAIGAGSEYNRGDNVTRTGRVRKPNKDAREKGIYNIKQVSSSTNYESWLKTQPNDFIADILGSNRAAGDFKAGAMTLGDYAKNVRPNQVNL